MGRNRSGSGLEGGGFVALPWQVLDAPAYIDLSHPAKALLLELARQYHGNDNGRMLLSAKHLSKRGWNSPGVIARAKRELLDAEFIFETVKGHRPNKASWYACTWWSLDRITGYDAGVTTAFERGAYRSQKSYTLSTAAVVASPAIATAPVVARPSATTSAVAIKAVSSPPPTTGAVHPLDMPSAGVDVGVGVGALAIGLPKLTPPSERGRKSSFQDGTAPAFVSGLKVWAK